MRHMPAPFSRRKFLGGASAASLGIATAALVGCGDDDDEGSNGGDPTAEPTGDAPSGEPKDGGIARVTRSDAADFDPSGSLTLSLHAHLTPIYNKLVRTVRPAEASGSADFTLMPDLAEDWEQVDEQTYSYTLRQGVTWHDVAPVSGREFVANDVVASYEYYKAGGAHEAALALVDSVEATDDYTVVIKLVQPFSTFMQTVSHPARHIFAPEALDREGGLGGTPIIGTGPFMFESYERGTTYTGVKNPNYFEEGLPHLDGFEMPIIQDAATRLAAFRSGDLHLYGPPFKSDLEAMLDDNPELVDETFAQGHSIWSTSMNSAVEPFNNPNVRRAMSRAFDRQTLVDSVWEGAAITGWALPWVYAQDSPWSAEQLGAWHQFDVADAKQMMSAAGLEDGFETSVFFYQYSAGHAAQVQLFQADMKQNLNIDITLEPLNDFPTYAGRVQSGDYEGMGWAYQGGADSSIDDFCYKNIHSEGAGNYFFINDPDLDRLAEEIRIEMDEEARNELIKEMQLIDADQQYRLFQPMPSVFTVSRPEFKGWTPSLHFRYSLLSSYLTDAWIDA